MNRDDSLRQLRVTREWDVLVIGGGATGLGAAVDAAARGYRTVLVEQGDFAQATSSRSTKLIHGGVRYLRQGNFALVREALQERGRLLRNAPELVHPLDFVIPVGGMSETLFFGAGLKLYDLLAGRERLGWARWLSRAAMIGKVPGLARAELRGGWKFRDAQFDDARLAIALAQTLAALGGAPLNYARVTGLLKSGGRVCGANVCDEESGEVMEIAARVVINATGVFSDHLRRIDEPGAPHTVTPSQGAHLVLPRSFLPGDTAVLIPQTADGRILFAIPWLGRVLLGTTDTPVAEAHLDPRPLTQEIEFLLTHGARHFGWKLAASDVLSAFAGLRPLARHDAAPGKRTALLPRDHVVSVSPAGLVSVTGGKWTTYRKMGEDAVNVAAGSAGLPDRACATRELRLIGASASPAAADEPRKLLHPDLPYSRADVVAAVRGEMARRVADVLSRRTRALVLGAEAAVSLAPQVAAMMAEMLGRDEGWQRAESAAFRTLAAGCKV